MCRSDRRTESALATILHASALAALLFLAPGALHAQETSTQAMRDARRNELESRQRALRSLENLNKKGQKARATQAQQLAFQQFKEDFQTLQEANFNLLDALATGPVPDYGQVKKQAGEIKKRASSIKTSLVLPESEKDDKTGKREAAANNEALKAEVIALDAAVQSFVTSPIFQELGVLDANNSVKARGDLETIIRLSEQIRRSAEALGKAAGKGL
ncbi:MAG TPA: hypothetical protein VJ715_18315 [Pyrinomonadaceae bacterium]|nr:hypothetical protein [Pyrinomonadaceae bacterium]